ncbi:MAG: hypothetical protein KAR12_10320, partial [Methylococcales bacterium]|nr:hypothetical protein [Methylococcales bacterium]
LPNHLERYQELLGRMIAKDAEDRFHSAAELVEFLGQLQNRTSHLALTKQFNKIISSREKQAKQPVNNPLTLKNIFASEQSMHKWLWSGIIVTTILSFSIYYSTFQNKQQSSIQQNSSLDSASSKDSTIYLDVASADDERIQLLLVKAETILDDQNLSLPKLKQAFDAYNQVLNLDSNNAIALQGKNQISTLYTFIQEDINYNLSAAREALRAFRLTTPEQNNALFYYQEVLRLEPNNSEAKHGKIKIANAYADLVETNLNTFEYDKAKSYLYKGLAIQPTSSRLLALEKQTNVFKDAPKRVFNKFKSIFD